MAQLSDERGPGQADEVAGMKDGRPETFVGFWPDRTTSSWTLYVWTFPAPTGLIVFGQHHSGSRRC
jgi:hypothetical protein